MDYKKKYEDLLEHVLVVLEARAGTGYGSLPSSDPSQIARLQAVKKRVEDEKRRRKEKLNKNNQTDSEETTLTASFDNSLEFVLSCLEENVSDSIDYNAIRNSLINFK